MASAWSRLRSFGLAQRLQIVVSPRFSCGVDGWEPSTALAHPQGALEDFAVYYPHGRAVETGEPEAVKTFIIRTAEVGQH